MNSSAYNEWLLCVSLYVCLNVFVLILMSVMCDTLTYTFRIEAGPLTLYAIICDKAEF